MTFLMAWRVRTLYLKFESQLEGQKLADTVTEAFISERDVVKKYNFEGKKKELIISSNELFMDLD